MDPASCPLAGKEPWAKPFSFQVEDVGLPSSTGCVIQVGAVLV